MPRINTITDYITFWEREVSITSTARAQSIVSQSHQLRLFQRMEIKSTLSVVKMIVIRFHFLVFSFYSFPSARRFLWQTVLPRFALTTSK